ncbi:MAG: hypothetical protein WC943_05510 [Elusimicrobiota bacterium]|jgi:hypothetical protein
MNPSPPKEYAPVRSVDDLSGLTRHTLAYHPEFVRRFIPMGMYCLGGTYLTYFDQEVQRWLPAPYHAVFGLPRPEDLSFVEHLIPITDFSLPVQIDGFTPKDEIAVEHWLETDILSHLDNALRRKRSKPLRSYYEERSKEIVVQPGRIDMARWDEYIEWARLKFGQDSWLIELRKELGSFFADSPIAMPISFYRKDRLIGVYLGGALPHQYEMLTHVFDPEFAEDSRFMIMAALDFGVRSCGRAYTMPDFYEHEDEFQKDWKNLWKLPRKPFYSYRRE